MAVINLKNTTIRLRGGTPGEFIDVKIGNGNLTYDEKRPMDYIKDRGLLDTVRPGDDDPMDVSFEFQWIHIVAAVGDAAPTIEDVLKQRGQAAAWTSSSTDQCEPFAVDVVLLDVPPCAGDTPETIILPDFRYETLRHDLKASTIACTGKCNSKQAIANRGAVASY